MSSLLLCLSSSLRRRRFLSFLTIVCSTLRPLRLDSRTNYYRSWAQEQILSHTDLRGARLVEAIKRGEQNRAWVLKKYKCADSLPPVDWSCFGHLEEEG